MSNKDNIKVCKYFLKRMIRIHERDMLDLLNATKNNERRLKDFFKDMRDKL